MSGLFGSRDPDVVVQQAPASPPPTVTPPPVMPDTMSPEAMDARRRSAAQLSNAGRSSTVLTSSGSRAAQTLAGGYGATKLGG